MRLDLFVDLFESASQALKSSERLVVLCHNYTQARIKQLNWRTAHGGRDKIKLVRETAVAFNALRKYLKRFD